MQLIQQHQTVIQQHIAVQPLVSCSLPAPCSQPLRNTADGALPSGLEGVPIDSLPTVTSPSHQDHDMDGPFGNLSLDALGSGELVMVFWST